MHLMYFTSNIQKYNNKFIARMKFELIYINIPRNSLRNRHLSNVSIFCIRKKKKNYTLLTCD